MALTLGTVPAFHGQLIERPSLALDPGDVEPVLMTPLERDALARGEKGGRLRLRQNDTHLPEAGADLVRAEHRERIAVIRPHHSGDRVRMDALNGRRIGIGLAGTPRRGRAGRDPFGPLPLLLGRLRQALVDIRHSNASLGVVQNCENPTGRDFDPIRPVIGLVIDLVERLRQEREREQPRPRSPGRSLPHGWSRPRRGRHRGNAASIMPRQAMDALRARSSESANRAAISRVTVLGPIGEGAQHPGDVAQRRRLGAALIGRPSGLTLEVDDDEVALGGENLAEVEVPRGSGSSLPQPADAKSCPRSTARLRGGDRPAR